MEKKQIKQQGKKEFQIFEKITEEFDDANPFLLSVAEVAQILSHQIDHKTTQTHEFFSKTWDYVKRFNDFPQIEVVRTVRNKLVECKLNQYEIVMMWNLCPTEVQEAKYYIPSLSRFDFDEEIKEAINEIQRLKKKGQT